MYFHKGLDELSVTQTAALRESLLVQLPSQVACIEARLEVIRASECKGTRRKVARLAMTPGGHHVREHSLTRNPYVAMRNNMMLEEKAELERALIEGEVALQKLQRNMMINDNVRAVTWDCFRVGLETLFGDLKQVLLDLEASEDKNVFVDGNPSHLHVELYFRLVVLMLQSKYLGNDRLLEITRVIQEHSFQAIRLACGLPIPTLLRPIADHTISPLGFNPDQILFELIRKGQELGMLDPAVKRSEYCARLHRAEAEMTSNK